MYVAAFWPAVLGAFVAFASAKPTRTSPPTKRAPSDPKFVSTDGGKFVVNGDVLNFVGTNAYWLHTLNTDEDIDRTFANISAAGIKVVRTWAFNDVNTVPQNGTWFQLITNGVQTINEGPNGLQKLDKVVQLAEKHGIYLLLALTNNWNPIPLLDDVTTGAGPVRRDTTQGTNNTLPRNTLSNDYGGMDTYVREFGLKHHDQFYTNETLINAFKNYTAHVVKRYCKSPAIFGWELANDPRCNSTLPATECNPQSITKWHSDLAQHVASVDTNHLVSSGHGGYFCVGCPKVFPRAPPVAPPQVSPAPGSRRRNVARFLTKSKILQARSASRKRTRNLNKREDVTSGIRIRGTWKSTPTRRQEDLQAVGPSYDGSHGVDSEDILNIPQIGFGSFQLFPDQNRYAPDDPNLTPFDNLVQQGVSWIQQHAETSNAFGKPTTLNGFGLVTQNNAPSYVPFDTSVAPFGSDQTTVGSPATQQPFGVTDQQRDDAYTTWLNTGLTSGLKTMIQYQWGQDGLTTSPGTTVSPSSGSTSVSANEGTTGFSPNDGYSTNGSGRDSVVGVIQQGSQNFAVDTR